MRPFAGSTRNPPLVYPLFDGSALSRQQSKSKSKTLLRTAFETLLLARTQTRLATKFFQPWRLTVFKIIKHNTD